MPVVFYSMNPGVPTRSLMTLTPGEIQLYRRAMSDLESDLRSIKPPGGMIRPVNEIGLSGSFPVEEIAGMIAQNKDCTHLSFFTGWTEARKHFTIMVPMKDIIPGDPTSGVIIDNINTYYSGICCQHPPLI